MHQTQTQTVWEFGSHIITRHALDLNRFRFGALSIECKFGFGFGYEVEFEFGQQSYTKSLGISHSQI